MKKQAANMSEHRTKYRFHIIVGVVIIFSPHGLQLCTQYNVRAFFVQYCIQTALVFSKRVFYISRQSGMYIYMYILYMYIYNI